MAVRSPIATTGVAGSCILAGTIAILPPAPSGGETRLAILAASSLSGVFDESRQAFDAELLFAASGIHYQSVAHGRPFDLLITANAGHAEQLRVTGVARAAFPLAPGSPVLVTSEPILSRDAAEWLHRSPRARIAIPNPRHAPFGTSAAEWLRHHGIDHNSDDRFVVTQSVESAMALVVRGAADAAFGAETLKPHGTHQTPISGARPIRYWCVVSKDAPDNAEELITKLSNMLDHFAISDAGSLGE